MQSYKRKITYFYQFHNGNIGTTAGFLKLEIRGDKVKIIINIQEPPGLPYKNASLYFYHEAGDHLAAIKVDEIESVNGMLTYQARKEWQQLYNTGRDLYTFDGVAVVYNDSHYYIGDFQDKNRKDYKLVRKENRKTAVVEAAGLFEKGGEISEKNETAEKQPEKLQVEETDNDQIVKVKRENGTDGLESQNKDVEAEQQKEREVQSNEGVYSKCKNCPYQKKRVERKEDDVFEKMIAEYPKLPMYGATELFQCVRIHPKDIGKLDMRNWKLGVNSFLTHGFYTYQYLLLGKMRFDDGSEHPIIGVPGVFSNREKYLANMFGFEQFIPVKKTGVKTGEFGYWIVEINQGL